MNTTEVYRRLANALIVTQTNGCVSVDAARLALYLAVHDMTEQQSDQVAELRERLAVTLNESATNAAYLRQRINELEEELRIVRSQVTEKRTAGEMMGSLYEAYEERLDAMRNSHAPPPFDLDAVPTDVRAAWAQLDTGERTWRQTPKSIRLKIVRWLIGKYGVQTQYEFNRIRPLWLGTAEKLPLMFGCSWADLVSDVSIPINGGSDESL